MEDVDEEEADGVVDAEDDKRGEGGGLVDHGADQQAMVNEGKDGPVGDEP